MSADAVFHVGCVSYLNATPLIAGLESASGGRVRVHFDVPSGLLSGLEGGYFDLALCPVVDQFRSSAGLRLVPVGGIACRGRTHTVKLFTRRPIAQCARIAADTDSHTSVNLLRVLWPDRSPEPLELVAHDFHADPEPPAGVDGALLIGDKVVTSPPSSEAFAYTLDLGEAWLERTGLPFVFATWMARPERELGDLPDLLTAQLDRNLGDLERLAGAAAEAKGWPADLALAYLSEILHYRLAADDLRAIERFREAVANLESVRQQA
ncbi:menaquinone biosynthetic enzyme MqnA/MqnD family protein [Mucisphaera calidilacus]|uniref:Chorismate dehydratase n=1 Tax=Mucisphaera calidilacus TaxID=2527982 RepID=A0A518BYV3_9BACT|nr:menaquinone biosynthesis protein [Mucisphaera calidilacus]QDU72146.1 Chorismate dehydratase [Mucisphaera calidilacus]